MEPEIAAEYYESGAIKSQEWYLNGKRHREDGPAHIYYYESGAIRRQEWHVHGKYHREDGPALIEYCESGAIRSQVYCWKGNPYYHIKSPEAWARKLPLLKIQDVMHS